MEFNELLLRRRSVRKYTEGTHIPQADIDRILDAVRFAPSWKNSQTGRYYVIQTQQMNEQVRACLPAFNQKNVADAPVLIVTAYEKGMSGFMPDGSRSTELGDEWGAYDLGLQNAYLILKAAEIGYDTLIMGIRDAEQLRRVLDIPASQAIVSVIGLGRRTEDPELRPRKLIDEIADFF